MGQQIFRGYDEHAEHVLREELHGERVYDFPFASFILDEDIGLDHVWLDSRDLKGVTSKKMLMWVRGSQRLYALDGWNARDGVYEDEKTREAVHENMEWVRYYMELTGFADQIFGTPQAWDNGRQMHQINGNVLMGAVLVDLEKSAEVDGCLCWNKYSTKQYSGGRCAKILGRVMFDQFCYHDMRWDNVNFRAVGLDYFLDCVRMGLLNDEGTVEEMHRLFCMM